eukprot:771091-Pelagomonas_calceolata.AAC.7
MDAGKGQKVGCSMRAVEAIISMHAFTSRNVTVGITIAMHVAIPGMHVSIPRNVLPAIMDRCLMHASTSRNVTLAIIDACPVRKNMQLPAHYLQVSCPTGIPKSEATLKMWSHLPCIRALAPLAAPALRLVEW